MAQVATASARPPDDDALYDPLTGLPGPLLLRAHLHHALRRATRNRTQVAVLALDVDDFGDLDARLGRELADEVLVVLAARVQAALRGTDVTTRLDADEFVVVCEDITDVHDATMVSRRVADAVATPMRIGDTVVEVRATVGTALGTGIEAPLDLLDLAGQEIRRARCADGSTPQRGLPR
jgi:diguanylate cyclase (GGDEF)-like protein